MSFKSSHVISLAVCFLMDQTIKSEKRIKYPETAVYVFRFFFILKGFVVFLVFPDPVGGSKVRGGHNCVACKAL